MKAKIKDIIGFWMPEEVAELKADEIIELFNHPDEQIGALISKIAYTQTAEDQADDFLNKVWMIREFLSKSAIIINQKLR